MEQNAKKRLILIDGNAIMHRAYHALPPLNTKKGELVNAVYGFTSTILSVISEFKPDYIAASFDLAGPTFRHEEYKEYKATRAKAPDEFYAQIPRVKEVVEALNIPIFEKQGFEADDVIGTLVKQSENSSEEIENIIVTGDLDTLQLVSDKTKVYTMRRGLSESVLYDLEKVKERYKLTPNQLIDFKGLRGDPSDNIPGVKGIGEKTASELLQKYETLEGVYRNIGEIKGAVHDKLEKEKMQAFMSKQLATIKTDTPVNLEIEKTIVHDFDRKKIIELLNELNFYSLVKRLPANNVIPAEAGIQENGSQISARGGSAFGGKSGMTIDNGVKDFKYEIVADKDIDNFIDELKKQKEIAIAIEVSPHPSPLPKGEGDISGIAFSWKVGRGYYIELKTNSEKLRNILEDENIKKIGYDLKLIYKELKKSGINLKGMDFDVMLGAYVLDPGSKIELEKLALSELGEEISFSKPKGQLEMLDSSSEKNTKIICQKADYSLKLKDILEKKINQISEDQKNQGKIKGTLKGVLEKIEMPLIEVLADMEIAGIKINSLVLKGILEKIEVRIKNLEKSIYELGGKEFNINSPQQLVEILFTELKLPTDDIKKTKTGFSTASAELNKLRDKHKIIEKVEEYRELAKLKNTYLDTLPELIDKNSRVHTTFNQAVTATGRLSSSDPNLQNIPIRTDLGQLIRTAFVAEDGHRLISADYSQIDLRAVAHVSGDKKLIEAFQRGDDIHKITASVVNKVAMSQVTDKMRRAAKALNFGVIYGMSVFGFSQAAGIERDDAKKFINEYMEKFSGVAKYIRDTKEFAKKYGYVETLIGRRRNIPEINSPNFQVQNAAERMATNMPIQGLAADIVKLAMIKIFNEYKDNPDVHMILQIHDEIILEVKENITDEVSKKVKEIMESAYKIKVPLVADIKIGDNWGEI
jgi:DNA polymerase-1